jgi:hypothetical protein
MAKKNLKIEKAVEVEKLTLTQVMPQVFEVKAMYEKLNNSIAEWSEKQNEASKNFLALAGKNPVFYGGFLYRLAKNKEGELIIIEETPVTE